MKRLADLFLLFLLCVLPATLVPALPPRENLRGTSLLLPEPVISVLASELSGAAAKRNLEYLARLHRQRGSKQFHQAAEFIRGKLVEYGLEKAEILRFPADGKTFYGTQKARPAWDAEFAELWELREVNGEWRPVVRLASWEAMPITLAQDSESANVTAELVDVGDGSAEAHYAGKEVHGKLVLAAAQPGPVARLAVERYGAVGIISYAQNQRTAWWKENEELIRWGHLDSFADFNTFAFMVSLQRAREFRQRLARGETIRLHAEVRAGRRDGFYEIVTATIPGSDPDLRKEEVAFSCHLDHQKPGANDNASGCATILEVARTFAKLIREKRIERPARTLRFIWPPEIEGTTVLLNARPDLARRIKAVIHMDMVGGGPETKAIFHVTRGPKSLPTFVNDVAEDFAEFANDQSDRYASGDDVPYPLVSPEGGKRALQAELVDFTMGSDHQVYTDSSFSIPAIYLNDWPDRYIHTNWDTPDKIDPTKLTRAGFIGAASAYFLARMSSSDTTAVWHLLKRHALRRLPVLLKRTEALQGYEAASLARSHLHWERALLNSVERFAPIADSVRSEAGSFFTSLADLADVAEGDGVPPKDSAAARITFTRNPDVKGPLSVFGYDYLADHYGNEKARHLRLPRYQGLRGSGSEYAYEVLNFVDGNRTLQEIRDAVSAEYGPVPLEYVKEYLEALQSIGLVESRTPASR